MPSTSQENGKLLATAVGAAAAGASLAVLAMKMIDSSKNEGMSKGSSAYRDPHQRPSRPSVFMNEYPSEEYDFSGPPLRRESSEPMLFPHNHEEKMRRRIATRYTIEEENNMPRNSVTVRVPATSANVGPGCTCVHVVVRVPLGGSVSFFGFYSLNRIVLLFSQF